MRIALISDIHEDVINLQLALDKIERLQCDEVFCLGDISGYSAAHHDYLESRNARECLRLVREHCALIITGNHDLHAASKTPKISGFEYPSNWFDLDFWERKERSNDQVWLYEEDELNPLYKHEDIDFLFNLPELSIKKYGDKNILFSHYLFPNLTGSERVFYHDPKDYQLHKEFMQKLGTQISFTGHRHPVGLIVQYGKSIITKKFGRSCNVKDGDIIHIPPVTRANGSSGFVVFDVQELSLEAIKI